MSGIESTTRHHADFADLIATLFKAQSLLQRTGPAQLDAAIDAALAFVGKASGADRSYLFVIRDMIFVENTHEWCAQDTWPMKDQLLEVPYLTAEAFWSAFRTEGVLRLPDIEALPVGSELRTTLVDQNIKALIAAPIWQENEITGFVGLDYCKNPRGFSALDAAVMQSLAASLGSALDYRRLTLERKRLQGNLQAANDRLSAIVMALPELLVETDRQGIVIGFHQSGPLTLAISPEEIIGRGPEGFLPPHVASISRKAMAQVDEKSWSETFDYSLTIGTEIKRFALYATARGNAQDDRSKGYLFVVRDVTESYRQENHIRQLSRVADLSTNMIILTDKDRLISWMNPASISRTGFSLEEAMGKMPRDILRLDDVDEEVAQSICSRLDCGQEVDQEVRALSKAGMVYWVRLNVQPLPDADGGTQAYMVVASDITLHKLAEARALRDRASAMDASQEGIAISQPDGRFVYVNPALRRILKLPETTPTEALFWHDVSPEAFARKLTGMLPHLYAEGYWKGEVTFPEAHAPDRHFDFSISVQDDGSFLSIAREITARKAAEQEHALLREQLQIAQSRQLVAQFAGGLAHDVANVLAVISGAVQPLKSGEIGKAGESIARIEEATKQAQALIRKLTGLGRPTAKRRVIDLRPVVELAADLIRPSLGIDTALTLDLPAGSIKILGETTEMVQVLLNLMINARDALGSQIDAPRRIDLRLSRMDCATARYTPAIGALLAGREYAMIEIADSGSGMDEALKERMLDAHFTTKGEKGAGLGLSIVSDILTSNTGAISVESTPGTGTIVRVFWPIALAKAAKAGQPANTPARESASLSGRYVLLVDSDDMQLMKLSRLLSDAGAEVASCVNPHDAIAAVRASPEEWDVVVTDHDLGPMTGLAFAGKLREIDRTLPIIMLSGAKALQSAKKSVHSDMVTVLRRPVPEDVMIAAIRDAKLRAERSNKDTAPAHETPARR